MSFPSNFSSTQRSTNTNESKFVPAQKSSDKGPAKKTAEKVCTCTQNPFVPAQTSKQDSPMPPKYFEGNRLHGEANPHYSLSHASSMPNMCLIHPKPENIPVIYTTPSIIEQKPPVNFKGNPIHGKAPTTASENQFVPAPSSHFVPSQMSRNTQNSSLVHESNSFGNPVHGRDNSTPIHVVHPKGKNVVISTIEHRGDRSDLSGRNVSHYPNNSTHSQSNDDSKSSRWVPTQKN